MSEWQKRLVERREAAGYTQGQVSVTEDITPQYLSKLENGINDPSVWHLLKKLARKYKTSADYILGIVDDPAPAATLTRWPADVTAAAELIQAATDAKRAEMLAVLTVMAIAAKQEEDRVNPLWTKLDETTKRQLERSIQIEGDLPVADIRGVLEALQEQEEQQRG